MKRDRQCQLFSSLLLRSTTQGFYFFYVSNVFWSIVGEFLFALLRAHFKHLRWGGDNIVTSDNVQKRAATLTNCDLPDMPLLRHLKAAAIVLHENNTTFLCSIHRCCYVQLHSVGHVHAIAIYLCSSLLPTVFALLPFSSHYCRYT